MFGSQMLGTVTGLVLVYIVFSIVLTSVREGIEAVTKTRGRELARGIVELLTQADGTPVELAALAPGKAAFDRVKSFYTHPLISSLYRGGFENALKSNRLPAYIPSKNFSAAVLDLVSSGTAAGFERDIQQNGAKTPVERMVALAMETGGRDLDRARAHLEGWFDGTMDRVSGWYKRQTGMILFALSFAVAIVLNVNSFTIAQSLWIDAPLRERMTEVAKRVNGEGTQAKVATVSAASDIAKRGDAIETTLLAAGVPIGWNAQASQMLDRKIPYQSLLGPDATAHGAVMNVAGTVELLLGWLATAFALTLGAPFWFDVLNKVMVIRSTVKPAEKSGDEGSEDRAPQAGGAKGPQPAATPATLTITRAPPPPVPPAPPSDWRQRLLDLKP